MDQKKYAIRMLDQLRSLIGSDFRSSIVQSIYSDTVSALVSLAETDADFLIELLENEHHQAQKTADSILVCGPICEALARRRVREAVPILSRILVDPISRGIREDISEILGELGDPSAVPFLIQALSDQGIWVRAKAAYSLGRLGNQSAAQPLVALLEDKSDTVKEYAIKALTRLKAKEASPALIKLLENEEEAYIRVEAAKALGELEAKNALEILKKIINKEIDEDLVEEARQALKKLQPVCYLESNTMQRQILATFDHQGVFVYQAFKPSIANEALRKGTFGKGFNLERMTWIKPSFGWMLYRSHYAAKHNQERILKIKLSHEGFQTILSKGVPTSFDRNLFGSEEAWRSALRHSEVRYQWDPDRDIWLRRLDRCALQVGFRGSLVRQYVNNWILNMEDVTELAHALKMSIGRKQENIPLPPEEMVYDVPPQIQRSLGITER